MSKALRKRRRRASRRHPSLLLLLFQPVTIAHATQHIVSPTPGILREWEKTDDEQVSFDLLEIPLLLPLHDEHKRSAGENEGNVAHVVNHGASILVREAVRDHVV